MTMAVWLTLDELSAYLKRGRSTLYMMARQGDLPASKIGRTWRFDRDEIDQWLRSQKARSRGPATGRRPKKS
jgi:excisionase family DNA binding protein